MQPSERGMSASERLVSQQPIIRIRASEFSALPQTSPLRKILKEHNHILSDGSLQIPFPQLRTTLSLVPEETANFASVLTQELAQTTPKQLIDLYLAHGNAAVNPEEFAQTLELYQAAALFVQMGVRLVKPSGEAVMDIAKAQAYLQEQLPEYLNFLEQMKRDLFADQPTQVVSVVRPAITPVLSAVTVTPLEDAEKNNPGAEWADGQTRTPQRPGLRRLLHE